MYFFFRVDHRFESEHLPNYRAGAGWSASFSGAAAHCVGGTAGFGTVRRYSARRATIGSTREARCAGTQTAIAAATAMMTDVAAIVSGSKAADAIKAAGGETAHSESAGAADEQTNGGHGKCVSKDQPDDVGTGGAQGHANTDFGGAACVR